MFTFRSLNVWGVFWPFSQRPRDRLIKISEHLKDRAHEIIGLQEVWRETRHHLAVPDLLVASQLEVAQHATCRGFPPGQPPDSGLALRLPSSVRSSEWFHGSFWDAGREDALKQKGLLAARCHAPGGEAFLVATTHFQAGLGHARVRENQARQLCGWLAQTRLPVVLMGDFNLHHGVSGDRAVEEVLHQAGFIDAAAVSAAPAPTYRRANRYAATSEDERLDRIFFRDGDALSWRVTRVDVEAAEADSAPLSDHDALCCDAHLSPTQRANLSG